MITHSPSPSSNVSIPWVRILRGEPETSSSGSPQPLPSISGSEQELVDKDGSNSILGNQVDSCNGNVGLSQKHAWKPLAEADSAVIVHGPGWPALTKHTLLRNKSSSFSGSSVSNMQQQGQGSVKQGAESSRGGASAAVDAESDQPPHRVKNGQRVGSNLYRGNHNSETRPIGGGGVGSHRTNSSSRRGNTGPRPRGGSALNGEFAYNQNHRHDPRNNWAAPRDSNVHLRPPPPPPPPPPYSGFIRPRLLPPHGASPFIPMRPFRNPMGLDMAPSPFLYCPPLGGESYGAMPLDSHPPPIFLPPLMPIPLATSLLNQIDFYFSEANLLTDEYLKKNMDAEGWVPINLIANFRRVQMMTNNIELILNSLRASKIVEVQGDKVRRRNDWMRWVRLPSSDESISSSLTLENETKVIAEEEKSVPQST